MTLSRNMYQEVVTYLYNFTFNLLLGSEWLQRMFNFTLNAGAKDNRGPIIFGRCYNGIEV